MMGKGEYMAGECAYRVSLLPCLALIAGGRFATKFAVRAIAALARVTPILAFPRKGRRDLSLAIRT